MFKITINPDNTVSEIFKEGRSLDIPEGAIEITDIEANILLSNHAPDYVLENGSVVLSDAVKTGRLRFELITKKQKELESLIIGELAEFGIENINNLKMAVELSAGETRFTKAKAFLDIDHFSSLEDSVLENLDVSKIPRF